MQSPLLTSHDYTFLHLAFQTLIRNVLTKCVMLCRNYAILLLASSWRYIVDMQTKYTAFSLLFLSQTGSTLWVGQKITVYTYGTSKGKTFFKKWKAIQMLSSQCPVIQLRTKLLLVALTMIRLWDSGFKMVDEHAEERIDNLYVLYVEPMQQLSSQRETLLSSMEPLLDVSQPGGKATIT